jgi:hypothetical protein
VVAPPTRRRKGLALSDDDWELEALCAVNRRLACVAVIGTSSDVRSAAAVNKSGVVCRGESDAVFAHSNDSEANKIWEPGWEPTVAVFKRRQAIPSFHQCS